MGGYGVTVEWRRDGAIFTDGKYNRVHQWLFDGGIEVKASSAPSIVPIPFSDPYAVDPEEAFVASLSSCHMLWFLSIAARRGFVVDSYVDSAVGAMANNEEEKLAMTAVELRPVTKFGGDMVPSEIELEEMHHEAHEKCFIASSVKTQVKVVPGRA